MAACVVLVGDDSIREDGMEKYHRQVHGAGQCFQSMDFRPAAAASPGSFLEMHFLGSHPQSPESDPGVGVAVGP